MTTIASQIRRTIRETGVANRFWTNKYKNCRTVKCNLDPALIDSYDEASKGFLPHLKPEYSNHPVRIMLDKVWDCGKSNNVELEIKWIDHRISGPLFDNPISLIITIPN